MNEAVCQVTNYCLWVAEKIILGTRTGIDALFLMQSCGVKNVTGIQHFSHVSWSWAIFNMKVYDLPCEH
jgi:hypothetical protein